jgi:hypothetical protein
VFRFHVMKSRFHSKAIISYLRLDVKRPHFLMRNVTKVAQVHQTAGWELRTTLAQDDRVSAVPVKGRKLPERASYGILRIMEKVLSVGRKVGQSWRS